MFIIGEKRIPQKFENPNYNFLIVTLYANIIAFLEVGG